MSLITSTGAGLAAVPVAPLLYNQNLAAYGSYPSTGGAILAAQGNPGVSMLSLKPAAALATDMNGVFSVGLASTVPTALAQNQLTYNALQRGIMNQLAVNAATNSGSVRNVAPYQVLGNAGSQVPVSAQMYRPMVATATAGLARLSSSSLLDMATAPNLRYSNYSMFPNYPDYTNVPGFYPPYPNVPDRPYGCGCRRY